MSDHAKLSPSAAEKWATCPGSVVMEAGLPDKDSDASQYGTAAHAVAEMALQAGNDAAAYKGRRIDVKAGKTIECDADMVEIVQVYLDYVRQVAEGQQLFIEQKVDISAWVPECWGTADAVILREDGELAVVDLKTGFKPVTAERNKQMALYALGCLDEFSLLCDIQRVRMTIIQPKLTRQPIEWDCSVEELREMGAALKTAGERAAMYLGSETPLVPSDLVPSTKGCEWCKAKATCPAKVAMVAEATGADFEDLDQAELPPVSDAPEIHLLMAKVDMIEGWCKAVRAETERRLFDGQDVPGYKLVQGRKGSRAWSDAETAEQTLKGMRLKTEEMYDFRLISPTTAEKLHKAGAIGPRQWPKLVNLITQSEGSPSVAPVDDKRPALVVQKPSADDFDVLVEEDETGGLV